MRESHSFWQTLWQEKDTPWDLNGPHPLLSTLIDLARSHAKLSRGRIYVPGCGRGHDAAGLAQNGFEVVACDYVPEAINEAKNLYGNIPGLEFRVADVFQVEEEEKQNFDGVYDRAMFCALDPSKRKSYVQACRERLKPSGLLLALLFNEVAEPEDGPPFPLSASQTSDLISTEFSLVFSEVRKDGLVNEWILSEYLVIAQAR